MVPHKIAPAIAPNNCLVCQLSELTPLTAITLADILHEAGLPPEMFQIVTGWPKDIDIVAFTGGVPVGEMIAFKAGYKRMALELGGNDPLFILNDLNDEELERAATIAVATGNSGQRCMAIKRILVRESVADRLVPLVLEKAKAIRFGDPMDPETHLGFVISAKAAELFENRVLDAAAQGAEMLYHPKREGALMPPVVVVRAPDDDDKVIEISNSTPFGLSSGVCTNNINRIDAFIHGPDVGTVNIWEQPDIGSRCRSSAESRTAETA